MSGSKGVALGIVGLAAVAWLASKRRRAHASPMVPPQSSQPPPTDRAIALDAHELAIARAVVAEEAEPFEFVRVQCGRFTLKVSRDVLRVRRGGVLVRVGVSPPLEQLLADHFGCVVQTPRIMDAIYEAARRYGLAIPPRGQWHEGIDISTSEVEAAHSAAVDSAISRALDGSTELPEGPTATLGKAWVNCARVWQLWRLNRHRVTYGMHVDGSGALLYPSASNVAQGALPAWVVQPPPPNALSEGHNDAHHDYSQTYRAVSRVAWLDGPDGPASVVDLGAALCDPLLAADLSLDGALPGDRLPGVPLASLASLVPVA